MDPRTNADDYYDRWQQDGDWALEILNDGCEIPPSLEVFEHGLELARQRAHGVIGDSPVRPGFGGPATSSRRGTMRLRHRRNLPYLTALLVVFGVAIVFAGGYEAGQGNPITYTRHVVRPRISASASLAQVLANTSGKAYAHGPLTELPGFKCAAWTNGAKGRGWVALVCAK